MRFNFSKIWLQSSKSHLWLKMMTQNLSILIWSDGSFLGFIFVYRWWLDIWVVIFIKIGWLLLFHLYPQIMTWHMWHNLFADNTKWYGVSSLNQWMIFNCFSELYSTSGANRMRMQIHALHTLARPGIELICEYSLNRQTLFV